MANERKTREIKLTSYQSKVAQRIVELLMDFEDNNGVKFFEQFKGNIFYNAKQSIPESKYPALFVYDDGLTREPFGIKRQDWWVMDYKILIYTLDHSENDMDFHYKCVEAVDRVCRENPRMHIAGKEDLSIHKGDVEDASYEFAFGDNFVISETEMSIGIRTKVCLANQLS